MSNSPRIASLDGVRGLASLVVLLYHCTLVTLPHLDVTTRAWLTQSPVKVLFAGTEAVLVFFVLSGLVVTLPVLKDTFSWWRYYPTRVLRLYVPVAASLLFAALLIAVFPRDPATVPDGSWVQEANATTVTVESFFSEASLWRVSYDINNVLWSLRWELIFSLALPAFVGGALLLRRHALAAAGVAAALSVLGRVLDVDALVYLPVFFLGTLMAIRLDDLVAWTRRKRHAVFWPAATCLALLLLIASWLTRPITASDTVGGRVLWGVAGIGAGLIIVAAIGWPALSRMLGRRAPQWLGRVSYSLYLVHAPLLGTLAFLWGSEHWALIALVGIPVSLVLAGLFHRAIETPGHRLARATGAAAVSAVDAVRRRRVRAH